MLYWGGERDTKRGGILSSLVQQYVNMVKCGLGKVTPWKGNNWVTCSVLKNMLIINCIKKNLHYIILLHVVEYDFETWRNTRIAGERKPVGLQQGYLLEGTFNYSVLWILSTSMKAREKKQEDSSPLTPLWHTATRKEWKECNSCRKWHKWKFLRIEEKEISAIYTWYSVNVYMLKQLNNW